MIKKFIKNMIPDKIYLKYKYKKYLKKELNLKNPITFNEKLQWLKLYDRKEIYTTMVDKYAVKDYVKDIIGEEYLIPTYGVYDTIKEINFEQLPKQFVIKTTHDSGGVVVCKNKKEFVLDDVEKIIGSSLKNNFYYANREWPYKNVKPRIIIEKYMGNDLNDFKIFCFNGKPKFTLVCSHRKGDFKNTDFYDNNWKLLPFSRENHDNSPSGIQKPENFEKMLEIAQKLSKNIPFVRVDLYEIKNKVYFGELTFYPSGGFEGFHPREWDEKIGNMLKLPK